MKVSFRGSMLIAALAQLALAAAFLSLTTAPVSQIAETNPPRPAIPVQDPRLALPPTAHSTLDGALRPRRQAGAASARTASTGLSTNDLKKLGTIEDIGPHHRAYSILTTNAGGGVHRAGRLAVMASGMNYWNGQQWVPSEPIFNETDNGFEANRVQHRILLSTNINAVGAVSVTLDGKTLRSTPVAIVLFDPATGGSLIIATVTNSLGILQSSNQVVFPDAFCGVSASLVYTLRQGSLEQDTVFTRSIDPAAYGFSAKARIQVVTEFYDRPQPDVITRPLRVEKSKAVRGRMVSPDLIDQTLGFGRFVLCPGRAHMSTVAADGGRTGAPVAKEFIQAEGGRSFLLESIEWNSVRAEFQKLPKPSEQQAAIRLPSRSIGKPTNYARLPVAGGSTGDLLALHRAKDTRLASVASSSPRGLVVDYVAAISGSLSDPVVFQSDVTYFIEDTFVCAGPTTIEAAVFKFRPRTGSGDFPVLQLVGPVTCKTSAYHPAFFTAADDCSVGLPLGAYNEANEPVSPCWSGWTGIIDPACPYGDPQAILAFNTPSLSNMRFSWLKEAVYYDPLTAAVTIENSQFLNCIRGVELASVPGAGGSGSGPEGPTIYPITFNNTLMAHVQYPLTTPPEEFAGFNNCTIDHCGWVIDVTSGYTDSPYTFVNCVLANIDWFGNSGMLYGVNNGFYNCQPSSFHTFGDGALLPADNSSPFHAQVDYGAYYLSEGCQFQAKGSTSYSSLLAALIGKTTHPPESLEAVTTVSGQLTLSPKPGRYAGGNPDLGFLYPALDYTVANLYSDGAAITIAPGTAIGVRNEQYGDYWTIYGFYLANDSSFVSHGTPTNPNIFTDVRLVQEGPFQLPRTAMWVASFDRSRSGQAPTLSLRFTTIAAAAESCIFGGGQAGSGSYRFSDVASIYCSLQDSAVTGGEVVLAPPPSEDGTFPPGSISWVNNRFERVNFWLNPGVVGAGGSFLVDVPFQMYNNSLAGGCLEFATAPSSAGNWTIKDNLFDGTGIGQDDLWWGYINFDYNAYWGAYNLFAPGDWPPLFGNDYDGSVDGANDKWLLSAPVYVSGPFGDYYLPNNSPLFAAGSRSPGEAGLSQYTTRVADGTREANQARVSIGFHYPAAQNGAPLDSNSDGVPNWVDDADGNGYTDTSDTSPRSTQANTDVFQVQQNSHDNQLPVLPNDFDAQGFPFTIFFPSAQMATPHGMVGPGPDFLSLVYTPVSGFSGIDTFTYGAVNDFNHESSATVTIFVNASGNTAPVAVDDDGTGHEGIHMGPADSFIDVNLLANDSGHDLRIFKVGTPQLAPPVQVLSATTIRYSRDVSIGGMDVFRYFVKDNMGGLSSALVKIDRDTGGNHAPAATSYSTTVAQNSPAYLPLVASDSDGDTLTYEVVSGPYHGSFNTATWEYVPNNFFLGADSIQFRAKDATLYSRPATISISVIVAESAPWALPTTVRTTQGQDVQVHYSGWDWENDYLTFADHRITGTGTTAPSHGTLSGAPPNVTYHPSSGFTGLDQFTFIACDGKYCSEPAIVTVNVGPTPVLATTANDDIYQVQQDSTSTDEDNQFDVLSNDTDSEGYALAITSVTTPSHGTATVSADSLTIAYVPTNGYYGVDTFTYTANNGHGRTATGTVTVFVNKTGNNNPSAGSLSLTLPTGTSSITFTMADLLATCSNPDGDGDTITICSVGPSPMGTLSRIADAFMYIRNKGQYGNDTFVYSIDDGNGGYDIGLITIGQTDTVGDGIPDDWQLDWFGSLLEPGEAVLCPSDGIPPLVSYELAENPLFIHNPLDISVANETVLSGISVLPLALNTCVDSAAMLQITIDDRLPNRAFVHKGSDGSWSCSIDTRYLANGRHILRLQYVFPESDSPILNSYTVPHFVTGGARSILVANDLTWDFLSSRFSSSVLLKAHVNAHADGYDAMFYDTQGQLLNTSSGLITGQFIQASFTPAAPGSIQVRVALRSSQNNFPGSPASMSTEAVVVTQEPGLLNDRVFEVAWGDNVFSPQGDKAWNDVVQSVVDLLADPGGHEYALVPAENRWHGVYPFRVYDTQGSHDTLLNLLPITDSFFATMHTTSRLMTPIGAGSGKLYRLPVLASEVAAKLGFDAPWVPRDSKKNPNPHPMRLTVLYGCRSFSYEWSTAFGVEFCEGDTVDHAMASGRAPRAFVGWDNDAIHPADPDGIASWGSGFVTLFDNWMKGETIETCMLGFAAAIQSRGFGDYYGQWYWRIAGCWDLRRIEWW